MRIIGVRDEEKIKKLLAAKAACEMAGLSVPPQIEQELGEGYEEKGLKDLVAVLLSTDALTPWTEGEEAGFEIDLTQIPESLKILRVTMASPMYAGQAPEAAAKMPNAPAKPAPT